MRAYVCKPHLSALLYERGVWFAGPSAVYDGKTNEDGGPGITYPEK